MKTVADFYPLVLAASEVASDEHETVVHEAIRASVITFMREAEVARAEMYIKTQCGVEDYPIDPPKCHIVVGVCDLFTGGKGDNPIKNNTWHRLIPGRDYEADVLDTPNKAIFTDRASGDWLCVIYSYTIGRDGCEIPNFIYEDWADAIVAGAVHRLKVRAGAPAATIELAAYEQAIAAARTRVDRKYVKGKKMVTATSFLGRPRI